MKIRNFKPTAVAQAIALACGGEEVDSQYAPFKQIKHTLTDGRLWYASLNTARKLDNLNLAIGEPFRVCLREYAPGKNVVDVLPAPPSRVEEAKRPVLVSRLESQLQA